MEPTLPASIVRLLNDMKPDECAQRNALSKKQPGMSLHRGQDGIVLESLDCGNALLVEFASDDGRSCDWLGVLYLAEVEIMPLSLSTAA